MQRRTVNLIMIPAPTDATAADITALIQRVIARYARTVDDRDLDGLLTCFAPDATVELADRTITGHAAIRATYHDLFASSPLLCPPARSTHLMGPPELVIRADGSVSAITTACAFHVPPDGVHPWGITYADRFVRSGDEWLIAHRRLASHWKHDHTQGATHVQQR